MSSPDHSIIITSEFVRNADSWALLTPIESEALEVGPAICGKQPLKATLMQPPVGGIHHLSNILSLFLIIGCFFQYSSAMILNLTWAVYENLL